MLNIEAYVAAHEDRRSAVTRTVGTSAWTLLGLIAAYLFFVLHAGRRFMQNRRPFNVTRLLIIYNSIQVIANAYQIYMVINVYSHKNSSVWCQNLGTNSVESPYMQAFYAVYFFYTLKVLDLSDTVFFILRKKWNQVTFLHVYHHIITVTTLWTAVRFYPGGSLLITVAINAGVHCIMYTYYLISALHLPGAFFIKPYITTVQLVQFVLNVSHLSLVSAFGTCESPRGFMCSVVAFNMTLLYLFMKFYRSTYGTHREGHRGFVRKMR